MLNKQKLVGAVTKISLEISVFQTSVLPTGPDALVRLLRRGN